MAPLNREKHTALRLLDVLAEQQDGMIALLTELVHAESPSDVPASQETVVSIFREALEQRRFRVRVVRGRTSGGVVFARPGARARGAPYQLLLGHLDTVWPLGTLEHMPVRIEHRCFHGPGSFDMKAGLVQALFALDAIEAVDLPLEVTPVFVVNTDEEIGSHDSTREIVRLARGADRALVLEPALGPSGLLKTSRKGLGRFTITVRGQAAHAGLEPGKGASAILELSSLVQRLFALNDLDRGITVNVGMIDGGVRPNVVAAESRAVADVRVRTHEDAERITDAIYALEASTPGTSLSVEGRIGRPPMESTSGNRRLWALAKDMGSLLGIELGETAVGGGSDGNTTSQYAPTLDGLGAVGEGAHAPHEQLELECMVERAALLALLLTRPRLGGTS